MPPIMPRTLTLRTALALGIGLSALAALPVQAQNTPAPATQATPPGPATQPPPPPGTTQPGPTQPPAAPAPPGTATAPGAPAPPAATPPVNYNVQYNGLIDGYYLFNFRNPKNISYGGGEPYYDDRHNSPALSLAELNVFKTARPSGFGFKATLMTGDTADINHYGIGSSIGEARYKNVQQLYGTYAFGGDGAGFDFGKFYTPFGYEVTESNGNYNYSRSTAYNYVPFYHAGARIYTPVPGLAALTATFYLVNGVYNTPTMGVQNDSKRPGYIGQLNYTDPKGKFTLISELGLDKQRNPLAAAAGTTANPSLSGDTNSKVLVNDNNFTYNFNANQLIGIDYVYRKLTPDGGPKETTNAYAFYYRQALTAKTAFALRFSGADDKTDGYDTLVLVADPITADLRPHATELQHTDSFTARPYDITATYEVKSAANFLTRFEYRHDHTNVPNTFYSGNDSAPFTDANGNVLGGPSKKDQDTLSVSGVFTF